MTEFKDFFSKVLFFGAGGFVTQGIKFLSLPILLAVLSPSELGVWGLTLGLLRLIPLLIGFNLDLAIVRLSSGEEEDERKQIVNAAISTTIFHALIVIVTVFYFRDFITKLLFRDEEFALVTFLIFGWMGVRGVLEIIRADLRSREKISIITLIQLASGIVLLFASIISKLLDWRLQHIIIICISTELIFILALTFKYKYKPYFWIAFRAYKSLKDYYRYSWPLIISLILSWLSANADRYIIVYFMGLETAGLYYLVVTLAQIINITITPFHFVLLPRLSNLWNTGNKDEIIRYVQLGFRSVLLIGIPMAFGLVVMIPPLTQILLKGITVEPAVLFILCSAAIIEMTLSNYRHIIHLLKEFIYLVPIYFFGALTTIALNLLLIPQLGMIGAAFTQLVVSACSILIFARIATRKFPMRFDWLFTLKLSLIGLVMYLILKPVTGPTWPYLISTPILGAMFYLSAIFLLGVITSAQRQKIINLIFSYVKRN